MNAVRTPRFGGFAPFISAWLIGASGSRIAPACDVLFGDAVSLAVLRFARKYGARLHCCCAPARSSPLAPEVDARG